VHQTKLAISIHLHQRAKGLDLLDGALVDRMQRGEGLIVIGAPLPRGSRHGSTSWTTTTGTTLTVAELSICIAATHRSSATKGFFSREIAAFADATEVIVSATAARAPAVTERGSHIIHVR